MIGHIETGVGFWNAIVWCVSFIVVALAVFAIRALGRTHYRKGTEQVKPYLSGTTEYDRARVPGENVYWGFAQALKNYYNKIMPVHAGRLNDYITWLVLMLAVFLVIITLLSGGLG
ncbi:MAG: hydrogenase [Candidatus Thermoplasmatota archaeon]|nr:hydrogenase [Candidatus Thermoplasmatota archaeon]